MALRKRYKAGLIAVGCTLVVAGVTVGLLVATGRSVGPDTVAAPQV